MLGLKLEVLRPFLEHLYPGRFSGLRELVHRGYNIEKRLARIEKYLAKLCGEEPSEENVAEPEDEIMALTQREFEGYLMAVKEIVKLNPLTGNKEGFNFFEQEEQLTENTVKTFLEEAQRRGLKTPKEINNKGVRTCLQ